MDLDGPLHVRVDVHLKCAGKSEKKEKCKVKTLKEYETAIYKPKITDIT
jgi:hypothetical protein